MKVTEIFEKSKKTLISYEILPPLKGRGIDSVYRILDPLMDFEPPFIDVTYHREDYIFKETKDGLYEKIAVRKRPGTVGICAAIMHKYDIEAVPHLICGGFTKQETENALIDLNFLGIQNVLLLRGDARKSDSRFVAQPGGHNYGLDLVQQASDMNNGIYLDDAVTNAFKTDFCIGVAGYPEKHFEAVNFERDLEFAKRKVEAGADYIVTQMFFDNQKYFAFVKACRAVGIKVPIIPGLKPLTRKTQLGSLPSIFYIDFPQALINEVEKANSKEAVEQIGIEWCIQQSKELIEFGVPCIHLYTMGNWKTTTRIVKELL